MANYYDPNQQYYTPSRNYVGVVALICSMVICFPPAPFAGLIMGIVAIRSKQDLVGGKVVAWLSTLISAFFVFVMSWWIYSFLSVSSQAKPFATAFVNDLSAGDETAILSNCHSSISATTVQTWIAQTQAIGGPLAVQQIVTIPIPFGANSGFGTSHVVTVMVTGPNGVPVGLTLMCSHSNGTFKVTRYIAPPSFPPTTLPAAFPTTLPTDGTGTN